MSQLQLVIGNKNFSSWSLRAWLAMELSGAPYEEVSIPLYAPNSRALLKAQSPTGKVPVLKLEEGTIWDSLAIVEYLAEAYPDAGLWPADTLARAHARALCAEMHSGFLALRRELPMDLRRRQRLKSTTAEAVEDIQRIQRLWRECRERYGAEGPYLFGAPTIADAFYAPVASRFRSYGVELSAEAATYVETIHAWPAFQRWLAEAETEEQGA